MYLTALLVSSELLSLQLADGRHCLRPVTTHRAPTDLSRYSNTAVSDLPDVCQCSAMGVHVWLSRHLIPPLLRFSCYVFLQSASPHAA